MPRSITVGTPLTCHLGLRLHAERRRRGMTAADVARVVGKKETMICRWEQGGGRPSLEDMLAMSALFGRSLHWLITGSEFVAGRSFFLDEPPTVTARMAA